MYEQIEKSKVFFIFLSLTFFFFLFFPLISATQFGIGSTSTDILGTYKQYDCIDLTQTCGNCSFVNISVIKYPNSSAALGQVAMTKNGTLFDYNFCGTNIIGNYRVSGFGDIDGKYETFNYIFIISSTGDASNFSFFLIISIITLVIFLIALYSGNEYIMFISSSLILITGIYGMVYGMGNLSNVYTRVVSMVIIALGMMFMFISSLKAIAEVSGENIGGYGAGGEDYDYFKD